MHTDSSAIATCLRLRSTVECTATVRMPSAWHARRMRNAISPRLAMTTLSSMGLGIRDWGFGRSIRLADAAFVRADQGVEAGEGAIDKVGIDDLPVAEAEAMRDLDLCGKFRKRAACHREESEVLCSGSARRSLGDVGWHADRGAAHLGDQAETFVSRKCRGRAVNRFDQGHRVAPNVQSLVRPQQGQLFHQSRIPNPESRRYWLQPITNSGWSNSTGCPLSQTIASTVPEASASIGLNIFIASMMPSVSPALTDWPTVTKAGLSGAGEA